MLYKCKRRGNARKAAILAALAHANRARNYRQIAESVGVRPIRQVARDLQRYALFGYVRRRQVSGRFRYGITRRGRDGLAFFQLSS